MTETMTIPQIDEGVSLPALTHTLSTRDIAIGAAGSRDWLEQHYDQRICAKRIGLDDILISTPAIAAWFERLVTEYTGVHGRIGRMQLTVRNSIISGETMTLGGTVTRTRTDETGCHWADIEAQLSVDGQQRAVASISVAYPAAAGDNPWSRRGDQWRP